MDVKPKNIFATTIGEFMDNAGKIFGQGVLGRTKPTVTLDYESKDHQITKATLSLAIDCQSAHWAGSGVKGGKHDQDPDLANKTAIASVEALNNAHEQKHFDAIKKTFDLNKAAKEKDIVGKSAIGASLQTLGMENALKEACEAIHKTEGLVTVKPNAKGDGFDVTVSPQGEGGCT